ncbi:MAG: STAS domain-containing protein [Nonomuraea sp.]|nr:STAS domain-containing protein [Nonomuraea sp.]NUP63672.1 STAS domain-containing protein [Nonomuraea sp.]NUS03946.1 STAS domain-containing protein [Nonomuraea sp.]NUT39040.1 STAS domain-containing protein [Thermoactinospora sp.]
MDSLHLTTSRHDTTLTVSLTGELDIATTEALRGHLLSLLEEAGDARRPGMSVVIEVSGLSFIDAAGLGILVSLRNQALQRHTHLRIAGVPPSMKRLLRITGLEGHLTSPS